MANLFIELFVEDMAQMRKFYESIIGMKVIRDEKDIITFTDGNAKIQIVPVSDLPVNHYHRSTTGRLASKVEVCLEVDDVYSMYKRVKMQGGKPEEEITVRPWGRTDFRMIDPEGTYIRITSPES